MSNARSAARNSFANTAGQLLNLAVGLFSSIYIARVLGRDQFGIFNWAVAMSTITMSVANAGIDNVIIRDVARKAKSAPEYLLSSFVAKILTSSLCYAGIVFYLHLRGYTSAQLAVGYIQGSTIIVESLNYSCRSTLTGLERQDLSAIVSVITNAIRVVLVIALIRSGYDVVAVAWVAVLTVLLTLAGHLIAIRKLVRGFWHPSYKLVKYMYVVGSTFLLSQVFSGLFDRADYMILEAYKSVGSVAVYGAAYRVIEIVTMIGFNLSLALYPVLSRKLHESEEAYSRALQRSTKYVALIGIPLCIGVFVLSSDLMVGLYSKNFAAAGACLSILIWSRLGIFVVMPIQQAVAARNGQLMLVPPVVARAAVNIGLNFILIPKYGVTGASIGIALNTPDRMFF